MTTATAVRFCSRCPNRLDTASVLCHDDVCTDCRCAELRPSGEWSIFVRALREAASGGVVHQRDVRPLIRGRIKPQAIGRLYQRAIAEGVLRQIGYDESDDVAGKNAGRMEPRYELRRAAA